MKQQVKQIALSALISTSITASLFCVHEAAQGGSSSSQAASPSSDYCTQAHPYPPVGGVCTQIGYVMGQYCNPGLDCPQDNQPTRRAY